MSCIWSVCFIVANWLHTVSGNACVTSWILCLSAISCSGSNNIASKYSDKEEQYHRPTSSDVRSEWKYVPNIHIPNIQDSIMTPWLFHLFWSKRCLLFGRKVTVTRDTSPVICYRDWNKVSICGFHQFILMMAPNLLTKDGKWTSCDLWRGLE